MSHVLGTGKLVQLINLACKCFVCGICRESHGLIGQPITMSSWCNILIELHGKLGGNFTD